jgi:hypothetical protein
MRLGQPKSRDKWFLLPGHHCSRATKSVCKRYSLLGSVRFLPPAEGACHEGAQYSRSRREENAGVQYPTQSLVKTEEVLGFR